MNNPYQPPDFDDDEPISPEVNRHVGSDYNEAREFWPRCPQCNKRLTATCPICKTTDNLFPLADVEFWDDRLGSSLVEHQRKVDRLVAARSVLFGEGDTTLPYGGRMQKYRVRPAIPALPYCGSVTDADDGNANDGNTADDHAACRCGCSQQDQPENGENTEQTDADGSEEELPFVVICSTCSEPFVPDFPPGCKRCGCSWGDENADHCVQTDESEDGDPRRLNNLQLAIILILAVASIFMLVFVRVFILQIGF